MSTTNFTPTRFRPPTRADMEEFEKEMKVTLANKDAPQEPTPDPADPEILAQPAQLAAEEIEELRQYKKRFADQTTYLNEQIRLRKESDKALEVANLKLTQQEPTRYASPEDVAKFEQEVTTTPILKQVMDDLAEQKLSKLKQELRDELEAEKALTRKQTEDVAKLTKAHPDWAQYDTGAAMHDVFSGWLEKQSPTIQRMADYTTTHDMDGAIAVLTMFKAEVKVSKPATPKQSAATNPASRSPAQVPAQKEGAYDIVEWNAKMDTANRSGNKKLQDTLMAEMQKARSEGRLAY